MVAIYYYYFYQIYTNIQNDKMKHQIEINEANLRYTQYYTHQTEKKTFPIFLLHIYQFSFLSCIYRYVMFYYFFVVRIIYCVMCIMYDHHTRNNILTPIIISQQDCKNEICAIFPIILVKLIYILFYNMWCDVCKGARKAQTKRECLWSQSFNVVCYIAWTFIFFSFHFSRALHGLYYIIEHDIFLVCFG